MNPRNMNCEAPFWLVLNETAVGVVMTAKRHDTEMGARVEAARLARSNPGATYRVVRSVAAVALSEVAWTEAA